MKVKVYFVPFEIHGQPPQPHPEFYPQTLIGPQLRNYCLIIFAEDNIANQIASAPYIFPSPTISNGETRKAVEIVKI